MLDEATIALFRAYFAVATVERLQELRADIDAVLATRASSVTGISTLRVGKDYADASPVGALIRFVRSPTCDPELAWFPTVEAAVVQLRAIAAVHGCETSANGKRVGLGTALFPRAYAEIIAREL